MEQPCSSVQQIALYFKMGCRHSTLAQPIAVAIDLQYRASYRYAIRRSPKECGLFCESIGDRDVIAIHAADQWCNRQLAASIQSSNDSEIRLMDNTNP